jgi:hypothetical protein
LQVEELDPPASICLCVEALCEWHFGEIASSQTSMAEAMSIRSLPKVYRRHRNAKLRADGMNVLEIVFVRIPSFIPGLRSHH